MPMLPGIVEGHLAILVYDPYETSPQPVYFGLIKQDAGEINHIRDYRQARM